MFIKAVLLLSNLLSNLLINFIIPIPNENISDYIKTIYYLFSYDNLITYLIIHKKFLYLLSYYLKI